MLGIQTTVHGNLTKDAELVKGTGEKSDYITFTVAVSKAKATGTYFIRVFYYRGTEKFASALKKGSHVVVNGSLDANIYVSQEHGSSLDLTLFANNIDFAGGKASDNGSTNNINNSDEPF